MMMKPSFYLTSVLALSVAAFALTGCDDPSKEQAPEEQAPVEESYMPPAEDQAAATTETAPAAAAIQAVGATSYATAPGATTGAIFLTITNPGAEGDRLVGASTAKAATVELHEGFVDPETSTMQMRKVDAIDIGPTQQVQLKPGGYHIMLLGLNGDLVEGDLFDVTLDFEKAPDLVVPVTITAPGAATESDAHGHSHGQNGISEEEYQSLTPPLEETSGTAPDELAPPSEEIAPESASEPVHDHEHPAQ